MSRKDTRCNGPFRASLLALVIPLLAAALFAGPPALAQVAESQFQTHQIRANVALVRSIAPEIAKRYGIDQGPRSALMDVVVTCLGVGKETVPVRASNLLGQTGRVKMQVMSEAERTSYVGVYKFAPDEVTDFDVVARPEHSGEELRVRVREHFPTE
jgi:hypothetical protein